MPLCAVHWKLASFVLHLFLSTFYMVSPVSIHDLILLIQTLCPDGLSYFKFIINDLLLFYLVSLFSVILNTSKCVGPIYNVLILFIYYCKNKISKENLCHINYYGINKIIKTKILQNCLVFVYH